jgi:hypothetical protein
MPAQNTPHPFAPGDRVVAIDTRQGPLLWEDPRDKNLITTPDGLPRKGVVYYVEGIMLTKCGSPGVLITGLRSYWKNLDLPWCASRFCKVEPLKGYVPKKRRRNAAGRSRTQPDAALPASFPETVVELQRILFVLFSPPFAGSYRPGRGYG